jgi:bilirubin oxidase
MKVPRGVETVVRFVNQATRKSSIHLHGSPSRAPFDGWAEDTISPGEYKDYYFPNSQSARMLWYHDHAMGITSLNSNSGQAGAYIIEDPAEASLNLPSGKYDIPLIIQAKRFNSDGSLYDITADLNLGNSLWGDVITVNGTPFPRLKVEPKRYRFRILNASVSRSYGLYFSQITNNGPSEIPYTVIASDAGLLVDTATVTRMYSAMAERWEIIMDFAPYASQTIQLRNRPLGNDGVGAEVEYQNTHMIMNFEVSAMTRELDTTEVRTHLPAEGETEEKRSEEEVTKALATRASGELAKRNWVVDHVFHFSRTPEGVWNINGVTFDDVANRILANVPKGTKQVWQLDNRGNNWTHPVHVHLVDFQVLHREGGRGFVQIYELRGLKDVVWLARDEMVLVEATYNPVSFLLLCFCFDLNTER